MVKGKVLFVDDEKRVLNSMRGMFRRDYELYLTTEGSEAVTLAAANDIDVIVADQRMPGMTGVEVLEKVRTESPRTVRILLTGYADPAAIQGSINSGEVFRFLSKPCPPAVLRETLMQAVAAARIGIADAPSEAAPDAPTIGQQGHKPAPAPVRQSVPANAAPTQQNTAVTSQQALAPDPGINRPSTEAPGQAVAPVADSQVPVESDAPRVSSPAGDLEETSRNPVLPGARPELEATGRNPALASQSSMQPEAVPADDTTPAESTAEVRQLAASRRTKINARNVGVVVFTGDRPFGESVHEIISGDRQVTLAKSLQEVADVLGQRQAGVLVTDATADINLLQRIIGALKQHLPELVTIVVSESRDAEDMINLINYGQVYRYVVKPVDALKLRTDINAAVLKHLQLLNHPELIQRHQVLDLAQGNASSATLNRFIGKVTRLRGLWSGSTAKSH